MSFGVQVRDMGERNVHGRWHVSVIYDVPEMPTQIDPFYTTNDHDDALALARRVLAQGVLAEVLETGGGLRS